MEPKSMNRIFPISLLICYDNFVTMDVFEYRYELLYSLAANLKKIKIKKFMLRSRVGSGYPKSQLERSSAKNIRPAVFSPIL